MDECYDRLVTHDDVKDLPDIPWHSDLSNFRWPRYQNGEYVNFGDVLPQFADTIYKTVKNITFHEDGVITIDNAGGSAKRTIVLAPGERIERPSVPAADGEPLEVGQTVWNVNNGIKFTVVGLPKSGEYQAVKLRRDDGTFTGLDPDQLTHERPRHISKDGVALSKRDSVWLLDENGHYVREYKVIDLLNNHALDYDIVLRRLDDEEKVYGKSCEVTTEKPPICYDGEPANPGDKVWRVSDNSQSIVHEIISSTSVKLEDNNVIHPYYITHTPLVSDMDGIPINRADTVYDENGYEYYVYDFDRVDHNMYVLCYNESGQETRISPQLLSHDPFVYDANHVPTKEGETVWDVDGNEYKVTVVDRSRPGVVYAHTVENRKGADNPLAALHEFPVYPLAANRLTHVKPEVDTWEKIEQDAYDYGGPNVSEFVLRCKKLAERKE